MSESVIEFSDFSFSYEGGKAESLSDINLSVKKGEVILLTGHSGCGKTTLTRCINGLIPDFFDGNISGKCRVCGMDVGESETGDFSPYVGSVFQDPRSQFFTLHVKTEIPFPGENLGIQMEVIQDRYRSAVKELDIEKLMGKSIFDLSSGEKQKVAIASVYVAGVRIYVLDEPSANLDSLGAMQLGDIVRTLKERGNTVIVSEHKFYYLKGLIDRVLIMNGGRITDELTGNEFEGRPDEWFKEKGLRRIDISKVRAGVYNPVPGECTIKADNLSFGYSGKAMLWKDASFKASGGDVIGIIGKNGAGKSTLMKVLMGLEKPKSGKIYLNGSYAGKQKRRLQSFYVMQDVDYQLFAPSVIEEMLIGTKKTSEDIENAKRILADFGLTEYEKKHPTSLSGGQKQRLSIALAIMNNSPFVYLDEPTSGLDAANMLKVKDAVRKMAQSGACVFVITHDYEFAADLFNSVLIIQKDCKIDYIPSDKYKPENLAEYFLT